MRIWLYALGYFACYAPYSALTKVMSEGRLTGMSRPMSGFELLPVATIASLVTMLAFVSWRGWWGYAGHRVVLGIRVPVPGRWTFLSGLSAAAIIATTTLAYTFQGLSIVFMMLLMRGGVLVLAPVVDASTGRRVRWSSWAALALSLAAMAMTVSPGARFDLTLVAGLDVAIYLAAYFVRLRFMSHVAKSNDAAQSIRYFVEETMVATPTLLAMLAVLAWWGRGDAMLAVRAGFRDVSASGGLWGALAVGTLSQGTGIFGALILLDGRENAFCVPVNRASSVLAGVVGASFLALLNLGQPAPPRELAGAALLVLAIVVLSANTRRGYVVERAGRRSLRA